MLTSLLLGLIMMVLYKPRSWCTFCPMGTMTPGDLQAGEQRGDAGQLNDDLHALRTGHRNQ